MYLYCNNFWIVTRKKLDETDQNVKIRKVPLKTTSAHSFRLTTYTIFFYSILIYLVLLCEAFLKILIEPSVFLRKMKKRVLSSTINLICASINFGGLVVKVITHQNGDHGFKTFLSNIWLSHYQFWTNINHCIF